MSLMSPEPHTQMTSSLGNSVFDSFFCSFLFFLSLSPFSILDFEPPYGLFLSA